LAPSTVNVSSRNEMEDAFFGSLGASSDEDEEFWE
jgi:hypothetical protein